MDPKKALKSSDRDSSRDENPGMDHFKMKKWAIFGVNCLCHSLFGPTIKTEPLELSVYPCP